MSQLAIPLALPATSAESRRARDAGLERARSLNGQWLEDAMKALRQFCAVRSHVTVEEFRHWWVANGGYEPTKHFAWGALGNAMNRCGWLAFESYRAAKSIKTHAHPVRVYR